MASKQLYENNYKHDNKKLEAHVSWLHLIPVFSY